MSRIITNPEDAGMASMTLVAMLFSELLRSDVIDADQASFIVSTSTKACRELGREGAAQLIEDTIQVAQVADVEQHARELGYDVEKVTKQ